MMFRVRVGSEDLKRYKGTLPRLCGNVRNNQHDQVCVGRKSEMSIEFMARNTIPAPRWFVISSMAGMVFLAMNSIDISEEAKVLTVITIFFVERLYEDAIEQKRKDEVKGYENHGFDTSSKSSLLFEVK